MARRLASNGWLEQEAGVNERYTRLGEANRTAHRCIGRSGKMSAAGTNPDRAASGN